MLDDILVGAALLLSAGYAIVALGPRSWKRRLRASLAAILVRAPKHWRLDGAAKRMAAAAGTTHGSCGGCDNCGSETPVTPPSSAGEIKIPVAKIGRRA